MYIIFFKRMAYLLCFLLCMMFYSFSADAAVYFMSKQGSVSAQKSDKPCPSIGYKYTASNCPSGKTLSVQCPTDAKYFMNCGCEVKNKFTSSNCKAPNILSGNSCDNTYFDACTCGTEYSFDSSNCKSPKVLTATDSCTTKSFSGSAIVDGTVKYKSCNCPTTYSKTCTGDMVPTNASDVCDSKYTSCKCNPTKFPIASCPNGAADGTTTCTEENGTKKYQSCKPNVKCSDNGYLESIPSGNICTQVQYSGLTCYKWCAEPCQRLADDISRAAAGSTITLSDNITCTNQSVPVINGVNLNGNGKTLIFNHNTKDVRAGLLLTKGSTVENLNINVTSKYRGNVYIWGEQTTATIPAAIVMSKDVAGDNTIKDVKITVKADTDDQTDSYMRYIGLFSDSANMTIAGKYTFEDIGKTCSLETTGNLAGENGYVIGVYMTGSGLKVNNADVNIKTKACNGNAFEVSSYQEDVEVTDTKMYLETSGTQAKGLYMYGKGKFNGTTQIDVLTSGISADGVYIGTDGNEMRNTAVMNIKTKGKNATGFDTTITGSTPAITLYNNAKINSYTTGSGSSNPVDAEIALYNYSQVNGKALSSDSQAIPHVRDAYIYDYSQYNVQQPTTGNTYCVYLTGFMHIKSASATMRLMCTYEWDLYGRSKVESVSGGKFYTSKALYTNTTATSTYGTAVKATTSNPSPNIDGFSKNTGSRLTAMPSAFNSIFTTGVMIK